MSQGSREKLSSELHDVIIIGAGVCGIYMLYKMLKLGLKAALVEAGEGAGGTWFWNRYPGARFDSESYTYGYSFSPELLQEWEWTEHFAGQPETLRYLNYVVDKFDLRDHMHFGCTVDSASFDEANNNWQLTLASGEKLRTTFLCTAIGMLSAATLPGIPGVESFEGEAFHTYYWPRESVDLAEKKVAVIGTGATGVQVVSEIADKAGSLTIFQRRPNWCAPLNNSPISEHEMAEIKASYDKIFAQCKSTPNGFLHGPDRRELNSVSKEERLDFWEALYAAPGFGIWLGNFRDVLMNPEANSEFSAFIADKIRSRVKNQATAENLIPKDHGFGTRRVPMETRYYEAYNRDNVKLVDLNETPIQCIDNSGIQTSEQHHDFDIIIYATGFDAITGAFDRIDIQGKGHVSLKQKWEEGPVTYLGIQVADFPNLFTLAGPQGASVSTNFPPAIETAVEWASDFIEFLNDSGYSRVEADSEAEEEWLEHVKSFYEGSMIANTKSWFTGYNSNVEGHDILRHMIYLGGAPAYRQKLNEVKAAGYTGFKFN